MSNRYSDKTDEQLWNFLRSGDKQAFAILYHRHIKSLYSFGSKICNDDELLKDLLQELFTEFWNKKHTLKPVKQVRIYLIQAFRYKLLRALSKSNKSSSHSLDDVLKDLTDDKAVENEIIAERKALLKQQLKQLPERQREVIHLKYFQNLTNEEIAQIINVNYQSVANLLQRALKNLRKKCKNNKVRFPF